MLKLIRASWIYGKGFFMFAGIISCWTYYYCYTTDLESVTGIPLFKLITTGIGLYIHHKRKQQEMYFYRNIGLTPKSLITSVLIADVGSWLIGLIVLMNILL
ncbi:MAG: hypothetical protein AAGI38_02705 [Bacteroidota bacterium]